MICRVCNQPIVRSDTGWQHQFAWDYISHRAEPLQDGEPCKHPGCLHHATRPCEVCGRIAGRRTPHPRDGATAPAKKHDEDENGLSIGCGALF